MPVIRDHTLKLKSDLKQIICKLSNQYSFLIDFTVDKKETNLAKVFLAKDEIFHLIDDSFNVVIENFSYSPLGKDLRRNISYIMMIKSLKDISTYASNIANYLKSNVEYKLSNKWVVELSEKIIKRLKLIDKLMTSESPEEAYFLSQEDESISILYRKELKSLNNKIELSKIKLTTKQKDEATRIFIVAIKSFDYVGDAIKEIAKTSLFISTGKLK